MISLGERPSGRPDRHAVDAVEFEVACRQYRTTRSPAAPRQRSDARQQLGECKGLYEVIIGAAIQSGDALFDAIRGRSESAPRRHCRARSWRRKSRPSLPGRRRSSTIRS